MTKTTCPTCGAKCEIVEEDHGENMTILVSRYEPIPQPDLAKLREAYQYFTVMRPESDDKRDFAINELIVAVKELLEEAKP